MTLPPTARRLLPGLIVAVLILLVAGCVPGGPTGSPGAPTPTPTPHPPLTPAPLGADPVSLFAWLFTPLFQAMLIILIAVYQFLENMRIH